MRTSHRGLIAIEGREGIRLHAYRDSKGYPTIGIGHLIVSGDGYSMKSVITQDECDALFEKDIQVYENAVNAAVKVPLSQNQFDALVSVCLNIGAGGFKKSTFVRRLNARDYAGAATAIMFWDKPPEIKGRRRSEQKQFLTPYPNSAATPLASGDSAARGTTQASPANSPTLPESIPNVDAPPITPADPSPQDTPDVTQVNQIQPYEGKGFVAVIKTDIAKLTGGNTVMQAASSYRDQIQEWGIPAKLLLNLAILAALASGIYLIGRFIHYGVWLWKEHQRVKAELSVNGDPKTPNLQWTNIPTQ